MVLVTGAVGFIGSYVCRALLYRGEDVVGIDNFSDYYSREAKELNLDLIRGWVGEGGWSTAFNEVAPILGRFREFYNWEGGRKKGKFFFYEVDICNINGLGKVFRKHDISKVIHLAAMAGVEFSVEEPRLYARVNVCGSVNLIHFAREHGVKMFVFASSSSVYGEGNTVPFNENDNVDMPMSPYSATKRAMEIMNYTFHQLYGLRIINARIFGPIYGPLQRPFRMIAQRFINLTHHGKPMTIFGDGNDGGRDTTYIDDEVDGLIKVLDSDIEFDTINVGSGRVVTPGEVAENVISLMGRGSVEYQERPKSEVPITYADTTKAKALLGFEAKWEFKDGLKRQVEIYMMAPKWYQDMKC